MSVSEPSVELPELLVAAARTERREEWLSSVPGTVARFADEWSLRPAAPFQPGGHTAWVAPVRRDDGTEAVLKVAWRHFEMEHEADALGLWAGDGAVLLHHSAELNDTLVLLLERCAPGTPLSDLPEPVQDDVIATLLPRLWVNPGCGQRFRALGEMCSEWADQFEARRAAGQVSIDSGLATAGIDLFRSLPASADRTALLCTDLHAGNVLAAQREPWLVIDPKPYVGDPTYDVVQHLLNCEERLHQDPDGLMSRVADLLGLDRARLRLWLFARCVLEAPDWPELGKLARQLAP